jgi:hypothetical protein
LQDANAQLQNDGTGTQESTAQQGRYLLGCNKGRQVSNKEPSWKLKSSSDTGHNRPLAQEINDISSDG